MSRIVLAIAAASIATSASAQVGEVGRWYLDEVSPDRMVAYSTLGNGDFVRLGDLVGAIKVVVIPNFDSDHPHMREAAILIKVNCRTGKSTMTGIKAIYDDGAVDTIPLTKSEKTWQPAIQDLAVCQRETNPKQSFVGSVDFAWKLHKKMFPQAYR